MTLKLNETLGLVLLIGAFACLCFWFGAVYGNNDTTEKCLESIDHYFNERGDQG
jgi:ABC-type transporter Mla subunit MlaD